MRKNCMPEVAKLLDVEVGETFSINQTSPLTIFRFTDKCLQSSTGSGIWITANSATLYQLLDGRLSIHKLPWKPQKFEFCCQQKDCKSCPFCGKRFFVPEQGYMTCGLYEEPCAWNRFWNGGE